MAIIDEQNIFGDEKNLKIFPIKTSNPTLESHIRAYSTEKPYGLDADTLAAIRKGEELGPGPVRAQGRMGKSLASLHDLAFGSFGLGEINLLDVRIGLENLRPLVTDDFLNKTLKAVVDDRTGIRTQQAIQNRIKPNHNKSV